MDRQVTRPLIRALGLATLVATLPGVAMAHKLTVFASIDCEVVIVEAKFSNGRAAQKGEVRLFDGENELLTTLQLAEDGTARVPLAEVDSPNGLLIEVDTGGHDNYWILTPEDFSRKCGS
jgi:nickel transport protein